MMNTPKSWLKSIYLAKKNSIEYDDYSNEVITYDKPYKLMINHQPISSSTDLQVYGQRELQMQKAVLDITKYRNTFSKYDLVYLDGASPENKPSWDTETYTTEVEPKNGYWANYRVYSVTIQNKSVVVYFEKIDTK